MDEIRCPICRISSAVNARDHEPHGRSDRASAERRRAAELIDKAKELGERRVSVRQVQRTRTVEIRGLDAGQLLELLAGDDG